MDHAALIYLKDDAIAQRLAVAWPTLCISGVKKKPNVERWATLAGVSYQLADQRYESLLAHGICRSDGTTDEIALAFIRQTIAKSLAPRRQAGKSEDEPRRARR